MSSRVGLGGRFPGDAASAHVRVSGEQQVKSVSHCNCVDNWELTGRGVGLIPLDLKAEVAGYGRSESTVTITWFESVGDGSILKPDLNRISRGPHQHKQLSISEILPK